MEGILEAPRGQRPLCPDGAYRPAHYWAPAHCFPYGTPKGGPNGGYGKGGCGANGCCTPGCTGCGVGVKPAYHAGEMPQNPAPVAMPQVAPWHQSQEQPKTVVPADYVPEQPATTPAPMPVETGASPAPLPNPEVQRPDAIEVLKPVPSEPVKPMDEAKPVEKQ